MPELSGLPTVLIPYIILSACIAAVVLGLRESIPRLKRSLVLSRLAPLILGVIAGYVIREVHPKGTTAIMGALYGLLAGSFSAPIYHAVRRMVAAKLKGGSKRKDAGDEITFDGDISAPKIPKIKPVDKPTAQPQTLTKGDDE
jgi:hypothetical protein